MQPLTNEEKEKHGLDVNEEFAWDSAGRIQKKGGGIVRRFDMTPEKAVEVQRARRTPAQKDRDAAVELLRGELDIKWDGATPTQQHLALRAAAGSSSDMKLFLEECRQVGKLAQSEPETERVINLDMSPKCLTAMNTALEIVKDLTRERKGLERERRLARDNETNTEDRPL